MRGAVLVCVHRLSAVLAGYLALGAFVALSACDGSSLAPELPDSGQRPPVIPIVVALGDSLTSGPGLRQDETYPALLEERARAAGYPHRVINAGVSGDTSSDAVRRLDRALVRDTRVLIIALGANDGLRGMPIATIRQNLATIIETAQARSIRVLLCGMETPPSRGWNYTIEFHRIFPDLAARYNVPLMPFLLDGVALLPDYNLEDGFHPNAAGHRRMAENMWPYLEPLLR
jgi:acyl-CoA thioesterase-1